MKTAARCTLSAGVLLLSLSLATPLVQAQELLELTAGIHLIQAEVAWKLTPSPASLPSDQTITDGWFLSRSTMRRVRSRWSASHSGLLPSVTSGS